MLNTLRIRCYIPKGVNFYGSQLKSLSFKKVSPHTVQSLYKLQPIAAENNTQSTTYYGVYNKDAVDYATDLNLAADHTGRQQNHLWTKEEIDHLMKTQYRHQPATVSDRIMNTLMYGLYHTFNFITGYKHGNASVKAMEWRLIVLESVAGVPGFVAAGFRHFGSLRNLRRDHGWIATLLEEAENERMHLLVCLKMFNASFFTRALVITAQFVMTPFLMAVYTVYPPAVHRFVGYLEETACHTYSSVIQQVETPGTQLHEGWANLAAPDIAVAYWKLPEKATFLDTLKCMFADECHHRDVNHTFAELDIDEPSPFALEHKRNVIKALHLEKTGGNAWEEAKESGVKPSP